MANDKDLSRQIGAPLFSLSPSDGGLAATTGTTVGGQWGVLGSAGLAPVFAHGRAGLALSAFFQNRKKTVGGVPSVSLRVSLTKFAAV